MRKQLKERCERLSKQQQEETRLGQEKRCVVLPYEDVEQKLRTNRLVTSLGLAPSSVHSVLVQLLALKTEQAKGERRRRTEDENKENNNNTKGGIVCEECGGRIDAGKGREYMSCTSCGICAQKVIYDGKPRTFMEDGDRKHYWQMVQTEKEPIFLSQVEQFSEAVQICPRLVSEAKELLGRFAEDQRVCNTEVASVAAILAVSEEWIPSPDPHPPPPTPLSFECDCGSSHNRLVDVRICKKSRRIKK